jgi:excisionase family DNA binding protein
MENPFEIIEKRLSNIECILLEIKHKSGNENIPITTPLSFGLAVKYLECSKSHLYKLTSTNRIPFSKRGKKIYFDKQELDVWLLKNKHLSVDEIDNMANNFISNNFIKL